MALTFAVLALVSGVIGFAGVKSGLVDGVGKAFFGTFMILCFITLFFGKQK
jgi:uncharacterized membrane protein YtjA (UPF0391 family)